MLGLDEKMAAASAAKLSQPIAFNLYCKQELTSFAPAVGRNLCERDLVELCHESSIAFKL